MVFPRSQIKKAQPTYPGQGLIQYLRKYGFNLTDDASWNESLSEAENQGPILIISVTGHTEIAGHTCYIIKCSLGVKRKPHLQWQTRKRLSQFRKFLHDPVKSALGSSYQDLFKGAPFAKMGGIPGTTARLNGWCGALSYCINSQQCSPGVVWLVLSFLQIPDIELVSLTGPEKGASVVTSRTTQCSDSSEFSGTSSSVADFQLGEVTEECRIPRTHSFCSTRSVRSPPALPSCLFRAQLDMADAEGSSETCLNVVSLGEESVAACILQKAPPDGTSETVSIGDTALLHSQSRQLSNLFWSSVASSRVANSDDNNRQPSQKQTIPPLVVSKSQHQPISPYEGAPVWLHIYDVTGGSVQWANDLFRQAGTGAFHAGVEVYGQEWSYGYSAGDKTGVYTCQPRANTQHKYRESVAMGGTSFSEKEVTALLEQMQQDWVGPKYNLVYKNCCHFSDDLCKQLGVGEVPEWVVHLAGAGATFIEGVDHVISGACVVGDLAAALNERYQITSTVEGLAPREIQIDDDFIEAAAMKLWNAAMSNFGLAVPAETCQSPHLQA